MAGRDRKPSREESDLWRRATGDVRPLEKRNEAASPAPTPPRPKAAPPRPRKSEPLPTPRAAALSHGAAPGVDRRTAEKLRRGLLPVEARLDLHGMTQAEAHGRLESFLAAHHAAGRRCVLVVTGKGLWREEGGVLKDAVPRWLNEAALRPRILSFCHAQPKDGGQGALYILLKRLR